jgi:hypothetical protein
MPLHIQIPKGTDIKTAFETIAEIIQDSESKRVFSIMGRDVGLSIC